MKDTQAPNKRKNMLREEDDDTIEGDESQENTEKVAEIKPKNKTEMTSVENLRICLFCNKQFDGIKMNLDHMSHKHGFYLLDVDCLIDLKGLLVYLAEKIQTTKLCVTCDRRYCNGYAVQQHMLMKQHCFMNLDFFEEEF
jgi:pre-60S factor REI1